jgi:hypothetical protein
LHQDPVRSESPDTPTEGTPAEHVHWQWTRLIVSLLVCLLIIGAAVAYEKFG